MKLSASNKTLLLLTTLLAGYQVSVGIDGFSALPIAAYTICFGVMLIAALLIYILGIEVLDSPMVVIVSTIIPLSLAVGLVWQHLASVRTPFLFFAIVGFLAVVLTRSIPLKNRLPVLAISVTHGVAGWTIFLLPIIVAIQGETKPLFALIGVGGTLISSVGLLLSFYRSGKPVLAREQIMNIFPALLFVTTSLFVAGFAFG